MYHMVAPCDQLKSCHLTAAHPSLWASPSPHWCSIIPYQCTPHHPMWMPSSSFSSSDTRLSHTAKWMPSSLCSDFTAYTGLQCEAKHSLAWAMTPHMGSPSHMETHLPLFSFNSSHQVAHLHKCPSLLGQTTLC